MNSWVISPPKSNSRSNLLSMEQAGLHLVVLETPTCTPDTYFTISHVHPRLPSLSLPSLTYLYIVANTNRTAAADAGGATPSASSSPCARVPARLGLPDGRSALLQLSV